MTKDEALRLALEALENSVDLVREDAYNAEELYGNYPARQGKVRGLKVLADDHEKAITAIKAALEAKDEPVAWYDSVSGWTDFHSFKPTRKPSSPSAEWLPLYANQPQRTWVGLTDEEVKNLCLAVGTEAIEVRLIEAKLKEKNT